MIIIETSIFTKIIQDLMSDDLYKNLQMFLVSNPAAGDIIQSSGGLRKLRWGLQGKGKRSGIRVIYYWLVDDDQIYMLYAYRKNQQQNLSHEQLKILKQIIEEELQNG